MSAVTRLLVSGTFAAKAISGWRERSAVVQKLDTVHETSQNHRIFSHKPIANLVV